MDLKGAKEYILKRFRNELNPKIYYHDLQHTHDVVESCRRYAEMEGLIASDREILETAAYFHDAGMLQTYINHEEASVELARKILPDFGYSSNQLDIISCIIMKTKLPQNAITHLGEILCDADLDYLGRPDFFMIAHRLRYEWELIMDKYYGLKEWYELQFDFLTNHKFFTRSARLLRSEGKEKNLAEIRKILGK